MELWGFGQQKFSLMTNGSTSLGGVSLGAGIGVANGPFRVGVTSDVGYVYENHEKLGAVTVLPPLAPDSERKLVKTVTGHGAQLGLGLTAGVHFPFWMSNKLGVELGVGLAARVTSVGVNEAMQAKSASGESSFCRTTAPRSARTKASMPRRTCGSLSLGALVNTSASASRRPRN